MFQILHEKNRQALGFFFLEQILGGREKRRTIQIGKKRNVYLKSTDDLQIAIGETTLGQ